MKVANMSRDWLPLDEFHPPRLVFDDAFIAPALSLSIKTEFPSF